MVLGPFHALGTADGSFDSHFSIYWIFQGRYVPDLYDLYDPYDLYDLARVAGWEPYNL